MTKASTIAIDMRSCGPGATGVGRSVRSLVEHMVQAAPERRFCLLANDPEQVGYLVYGENVELVSVPCSPTQHPTNEWWMNFRLRRALKERNVDVYYGPAFLVPFRSIGIPMALGIHDLSSFEGKRYQPRRFQFFLRWMVRLGVRQASRIIVPTEHVRSGVISRFGVPSERVAAIPHGAPPPPANSSEDKQREIRGKLGIPDKYVLAIGTLEPRKNPIGLAKALSQIPEQGRPALVWVGADGYRSEELEAEMREILGDLVRLAGVSDAQLPYILGGASALAYLSFSEGFGLPILESMAAGIPVVCSDIPPHREVADEAALYADPFDSALIADCLKRLLGDQAMRERLIDAGSARTEEFIWSNAASLALDVLDDAVSAV